MGTGTGWDEQRGWCERTDVRWGRGREREQGRGREWTLGDEHRMATGTGGRTEFRVVAETGTGTWTGIETRKESRRAEERIRSPKTRTRVINALWETGETWVEREITVAKNVLVQ